MCHNGTPVSRGKALRLDPPISKRLGTESCRRSNLAWSICRRPHVLANAASAEFGIFKTVGALAKHSRFLMWMALLSRVA